MRQFPLSNLKSLVVLWSIIGSLLSGDNVHGQQRATSMGAIQSILLYESAGPWTGQARGDAYLLRGENSDSDIKYWWLDTDQSQNGKRRVKVTVDVQSGNGIAGLLYGYQEDPKSYFMITVNADNTILVYERTPQGMEPRISTTTLHRGPVTLEITEEGSYIDISINGQSIGGFGNDRMGKGKIGIVAAGSGQFEYRDFEVGQVGEKNRLSRMFGRN